MAALDDKALDQLFREARSYNGWTDEPVTDEEGRKVHGLRNSALQGAYLMLAARALGLDCGPMSGFDHAKVDAAFFADEPRCRSNFLCAIGHGDPASIFARSPRPEFDTFNRID